MDVVNDLLGGRRAVMMSWDVLSAGGRAGPAITTATPAAAHSATPSRRFAIKPRPPNSISAGEISREPIENRPRLFAATSF